MQRLALLASLAAAATTGCLRTTTFQCESSSQCGAGGTCEAVGFCSFADPACPSGSRFGEHAGSLSNTCVGGTPGEDGGVDGPVVDAPPDAPPDAAPPACPATYAGIGVGTHVYRRITGLAQWQTQRTACAAEGGYLVIPDDQAELTAIAALAAGEAWIGVNDLNTEGSYVNVKNLPQTFLPWAAGEPDNGPGGQADCVQLDAAGMFADTRCNETLRAICECEPP